jgi:hypothetical protein
MIAGTEVSPRVNNEKTPRKKVHRGRAGKSSFSGSKTAAVAGDEESIITGL